MDILTKRGAETVQQELDAVAIWQKKFPMITYIHTQKNKPAAVDAVLSRDGEVVAVVETKCRQMTLATFHDEYKMKWLLTFDKVMKAKAVADGFCVPLVGFLYLVPDKTLLVQRIWTPEAGFQVNFTIEKTVTQATVNGGQATRDNAYIGMEAANIYV